MNIKEFHIYIKGKTKKALVTGKQSAILDIIATAELEGVSHGSRSGVSCFLLGTVSLYLSFSLSRFSI